MQGWEPPTLLWGALMGWWVGFGGAFDFALPDPPILTDKKSYSHQSSRHGHMQFSIDHPSLPSAFLIS